MCVFFFKPFLCLVLGNCLFINHPCLAGRLVLVLLGHAIPIFNDAFKKKKKKKLASLLFCSTAWGTTSYSNQTVSEFSCAANYAILHRPILFAALVFLFVFVFPRDGVRRMQKLRLRTQSYQRCPLVSHSIGQTIALHVFALPAAKNSAFPISALLVHLPSLFCPLA